MAKITDRLHKALKGKEDVWRKGKSKKEKPESKADNTKGKGDVFGYRLL